MTAETGISKRARRDLEGRFIDWESFDASALTPVRRATIGQTWLARMKQEHLAVGAFATLASELADEGCEPVVLSLITRASSDEVRHTQVCRRFAIALVGAEAVPARLRGVPKLPMQSGSARETRVLLRVTEMCCLSETFTGVYLTEMLARTSHAPARHAVESLLEDEIDHGRVGWAYLAERARDERLAGLAEALPSMLDRTMGRVIEATTRKPELDDPELEAFGYLGNDAAAAVYRRTLRDVVLPGLEMFDIDLRATRAHVTDRGWL